MGCYPLEDYFLEKEGIFLLLDLLAVSMIITTLKQKINVYINPFQTKYHRTLFCDKNVPSNHSNVCFYQNPYWRFIICIGILKVLKIPPVKKPVYIGECSQTHDSREFLWGFFPPTFKETFCEVLGYIKTLHHLLITSYFFCQY